MEDFNSKYSGEQVEALLDQVASGNAGGGGGGITVETDPIFSASPAAVITEEQIVAWDDLDEMVNLLDADVAQLTKDVMGVQESLTDLDTIRSGAAKGATAVQPEDISEFITIEDVAEVAKTGNYNDLVNTPTIPSAVTESTVSGWGFTKNTGTYSKPSGGIPKSDLASDVQTSLGNADNAVQKGMVGTLNIIEVEGVYDGDYVYALPTAAAKNVNEDYDDIILSRGSVKTINGESIFGIGDIPISGGSGEQGPQGDKGDKGDTGVGVQSVAQTTTSNADGGSNIVTVTLTDGTTSTFSVKNGSKGSTGANGTNGVSVSSVKQTTTSTADGGTNVVTVTLSNGTTSTFNVKNGSKGNNGTNGTNGKDGADGEDGATFTPSVDSSGNLSWTNNKGLTNPPTVNIKGPKGDASEGGGGKELVLNKHYFDDASPIQPNKIYIKSISSFTYYIGAFQEVSDYDEYCIIFKYPETGFYLPESVKFANGQIPTIEYDTECELSVVGIGSGANRTYHAVLTPFKPV